MFERDLERRPPAADPLRVRAPARGAGQARARVTNTGGPDEQEGRQGRRQEGQRRAREGQGRARRARAWPAPRRAPASPPTRAPAIRSAAPRAGAGSPASPSPPTSPTRRASRRLDLGLRALMAGIVGYMLAWACAVTVWRHLVLAELRAALERAGGIRPRPDPRRGPARRTAAPDGRRRRRPPAPDHPATEPERPPWIRSTRSPRSHRTSRRSPRRRWSGGSTATLPFGTGQTSDGGDASSTPAPRSAPRSDRFDYGEHDPDDDDDSGLHINVTA